MVEPSLSELAPKTVADYRYTWGLLEPLIGPCRVADTTHRSAQAMIPAELARMQMGHAGIGVAEQHYLVANEQLLRLTADMLCALFGEIASDSSEI